MLLGEPPPSPADVYFKLFGFPVRIHPFFWLIALILGIHGSPTLQALLAWVAAVFVGVLVHELGHALAMRYYGQDPWITLYGMGGLTSSRIAAYGGRENGPFAQVFISFAGPLAGFVLAGVIIGLAIATNHPVFWSLPVPFIVIKKSIGASLLVNDLLQVSFLWGIINLFPIYPLDGGQIARELFQLWHPREGIRYSLVLSMVAAGGLAVYGLLAFGSLFIAFMFGYLSYSSYMALQAYNGYRGR
jgi:stage IV sporulation protein FB